MSNSEVLIVLPGTKLHPKRGSYDMNSMKVKSFAITNQHISIGTYRCIGKDTRQRQMLQLRTFATNIIHIYFSKFFQNQLFQMQTNALQYWGNTFIKIKGLAIFVSQMKLRQMFEIHQLIEVFIDQSCTEIKLGIIVRLFAQVYKVKHMYLGANNNRYFKNAAVCLPCNGNRFDSWTTVQSKFKFLWQQTNINARQISQRNWRFITFSDFELECMKRLFMVHFHQFRMTR